MKPATAAPVPPKMTILKKALPYLIFLLLCVTLYQPVVSNDTFWLLNTGKYIVTHGFPSTDPFTMHEGLHITTQQWLSTVIYWFTESKLGFNTLFILCLACYFLICSVIYLICNKISNNRPISFLITIFTGVYLSYFIKIRPQIFSSLIFGLEIYILECFISHGKTVYLFLMPLLSLLLINLHAALWVFFPLLFIPFIIDGFRIDFWGLKTQRYQTLHLIISFTASCAAGFINPYGLNNVLYIFNAYFPNANLMRPILELLPPNINDSAGIIFYIYLFALIAIYMSVKSNTRVRYILITAGALLMSLSSLRNVFLFLVCALPLVAYYLRDLHFPDTPHLWKKRTIVISLSLVTLAIFLAANHRPFTPELFAPRRAVDFIYNNEALFKDGRLFNEFNTGGYLEYCGLITFIDSREEVFIKSFNKKNDILIAYDQVLAANGIDYKEFIKTFALTHFLITKHSFFDIYLGADPDYKKLYEDELFVIYGRASTSSALGFGSAKGL